MKRPPPATDVYSLGVVLYQFLTGRLPYEGSSLAELAVRQQNERPLHPRTYNGEVSESVGGAVMRALDPEPEIRYRSAAEMSDGLQRGLLGEDVTVPLAVASAEARTRVARAETATRPLERSARTAARKSGGEAPPLPPVSPVNLPPRPTVPKRSLMSRTFRFLGGVLALVLIAAAVAGGVLALTDRSATVKVRTWTERSVDGLTGDFRDYVRQNTQ